MFHCGLLLVLLNLSPDVGGSVSQKEVDKHLDLGRDFLAKGQFRDALTHYHAAIDGDPNNYLTYYKRGTVFLALGKAKQASQDWQKVLQLKSDFTPARLQRAHVLLKQAEFNEAENEYINVLNFEINNQEANDGLAKTRQAKYDYDDFELMVQNQDYHGAIDLLTKIIEVCPWSVKLRELRADFYIDYHDDITSAISDIRFTTKLVSDNTNGYYKLSSMLYRLGNVEDALKEIRECLKLDQDHKPCSELYKKIKKIYKNINDASKAEELRDYNKCINSAKSLLNLEKDMENVRYHGYHSICKCAKDTDTTLSIKNCLEAVKIKKDEDILIDTAEAYLSAELYDDAIRTLNDALKIDSGNVKIKEMLQKAQQRQKMSESRDYYKILGVSRSATKREIIKAYRKAAQKWHPDNFQEGNEKKQAEKKFIDIAAAKEVLTDQEKRAKFDRGEDPLDPESGKHSGFNPFQEFHQFQGSPFQFKFHFN
ncbi:hypothetical protein HCN44_005191 [Aphidius gifuensis]|uniref:J domain-containing protein n=1 Tax=Aphidius gifuensis TaxID=684658 RepID=A0A834XUQ7_APHGI|nr:dnaJ homolog subfamily C member 3 [Aphidius gifuensis]KAF7992847.1 hypothetical protein HCN44_005191 [Aphidius gifuensis]